MRLSVALLVALLGLFLLSTVVRSEEEVGGLSADEADAVRSGGETFGYKAEVNQLMHLIINSLYSKSDVFLRELVSNSADALEKIRVRSLTNPEALGDTKDLEIRIRADPETRQLHIVDTGVGMTKDELITNLGTIAKSGTKEFAKALTEADVNSLIGQFGVGFYSAFLVADRVTVVSKSNEDDKQWVWESDAVSDFLVAEDPRGNTLGRGTHITLHLKEDHVGLTEPEELERLVAHYSEFIGFPIFLWKSHEETNTVDLTEDEIAAIVAEREAAKEAAKEDEDEDEEDLNLEDEDEDDEEEEEEEPVPTTKDVTETVWAWERANLNAPVWTRSPQDVTEEEYSSFYKAISKDFADPLAHSHFKAEGGVNFKAVLFVPPRLPKDAFDATENSHGLKLYVKRVFITDDFFDVLPKYLSFLRGVVDAEDIDLNVSREILQQSKTLTIIKKKVVRKAIAMFQSLAKDEIKFAKFWEHYAKAIKFGVIEDKHNRARLAKLLHFVSSKDGELTSLADYVGRMIDGQDSIYYLAGESMAKIESSPLLERLSRRGIEVLYMDDPIDEYVASHLDKYDSKYALVNVARDGLKLPGGEDDDDEAKKEEEKETAESFKNLIEFLKEEVKDKISNAKVSTRLVKSPAALVAAAYGATANMERILRAQALGEANMPFQQRPVLELNAKHPIVQKLQELVGDGEDVSEVAKDTARLLYETAALSSGYSVEAPRDFSSRVYRMMKLSLNLDADAEAPDEEEIVIPAADDVQSEDVDHDEL